jgi:hypothetical protein
LPRRCHFAEKDPTYALRLQRPATVTVVALYVGQEPNELTTLELPVVLRNSGPVIARIEYGYYLHGPKGANALRVVLPNGSLLHDPIIDGRNKTIGGWLEFDVKCSL